MITKRQFLLGGVAMLGAGTAARLLYGTVSGAVAEPVPASKAAASRAGGFEVVKTEAEWRRILTPGQYKILRGDGTEPAGSSPLNAEKRTGTYHCAGCEHPLFASGTKYESGTGWPSFYEPLRGAVGTSEDKSWFMVRTEVHCARCGGHLGHVFKDGPEPTGLRYCLNGAALDFVPA